jgi:DNA polymerase III epsilon subunit-like protein
LDLTYVVTDAEFDGPTPGRNSMMSFASVAVTGGRIGATFEAVLAPLPEAEPDAFTLKWFHTVPEALAAATLGPAPPGKVMTDFVAWVRALPGDAVFAAHPLALDGVWFDYYLQRFAGERLMEGPWKKDRLFRTAALCIRSFAAGRLGWQVSDCSPDTYPPAWLGDHSHSHRAIDDALGYAHLLIKLLARPAI